MKSRSFFTLKHFNRRILEVSPYAADTRLKKKVHRNRTKVHATIHFLLPGLSTFVIINNFGRRGCLDHSNDTTGNEETGFMSFLRCLPFEQYRNGKAGHIQFTLFINNTFGSRNQLGNTVYLLEMSVFIYTVTIPAQTGTGHQRPVISGERKAELHKIQIIFQRFPFAQRNIVSIETIEAHTEAGPVGRKVPVPGGNRYIQRLDMFAAFITLPVTVVPFKNHFIINRFTIFIQLIYPHLHPVAVIFDFYTFLFQCDNRIGRYRFYLCCQQTHHGETGCHNQY